MEFDSLSRKVIGLVIEVHRELGPGLLESTYEKCLVHELNMNLIENSSQVEIPIIYKGFKIDCGFRLDLLIQEKLIIELKSVKTLLPIHEAQLLTYMKLAKIKTGLLINFNRKLIKDEIKRLVI